MIATSHMTFELRMRMSCIEGGSIEPLEPPFATGLRSRFLSISYGSMPITRGSTTGCDIYSNSGLLHVVACSEVDAGVEAGGSLLSARPFLLCL